MKPVVVQVENVKNMISFLFQMQKRMGTDSFGLVWGRAGRGKTRTLLYCATQYNCVYVEAYESWSVLWMLQDICRQLKLAIPSRKKAAFEAIVQSLLDTPRMVIIDEIDRTRGRQFVETIRDLARASLVPWILAGEEGLRTIMLSNRRLWSRTYLTLDFKPWKIQDIIYFAGAAADLTFKKDTKLKLSADCATVIHQAFTDIRKIEHTVEMLETMCNANQTEIVTMEMTRVALKKVDPRVFTGAK